MEGNWRGVTDDVDEGDDEEEMDIGQQLSLEKVKKIREKGIRVVSAFEGYSYDYGMRVGDKLVAVDSTSITPAMSVEDVRNMLRGAPETDVSITFERVGSDGLSSFQEELSPFDL